MYGVFTYMRVIFRANAGKYFIHGAYGISNYRYQIVQRGHNDFIVERRWNHRNLTSNAWIVSGVEWDVQLPSGYLT